MFLQIAPTSMRSTDPRILDTGKLPTETGMSGCAASDFRQGNAASAVPNGLQTRYSSGND
jgi:hypothetical protein